MAIFSVMTKARRKNDPPFNPYVYVVLSEHFKDPGGNITLTPHLMTEIEIDEAVDLLIKQLEKARNKAKKELQKAKEQNPISAR
jgi:hypothetical protein